MIQWLTWARIESQLKHGSLSSYLIHWLEKGGNMGKSLRVKQGFEGRLMNSLFAN